MAGHAMFGVESEYAVSGIKGNEPIAREEIVERLVRVAHSKLVHLADACSSSGMFLTNGARFYIDCGLHPEYATPECTTPWEVARHIKAGERILEGLIADVQSETGDGTEIMAFTCNVDYSGSKNTWGCHESYMHRTNPASLPSQLIAHLVTRVIYTGAGGFNPLINGLDFCIAPRLTHMQQVVSGDSTGNRGIFHTKNESLSREGYNRLHIICGESLYSETAITLKIGATAIVVAMAEQGLRPGSDLRLASPLEAMRAISCDTACRQKIRLTNGREVTAIEIQRRLLRVAKDSLGTLPVWADALCSLWRQTLDQLENGAPDSVDTILDWAIKHRLFLDRALRRGVPWQRFPFLNSIAENLSTALTGAGLEGQGIPLDLVLSPKTPVPEEVARSGNALAAKGLGWDDLERFLMLRSEFCQIDTRFGQIGPRGIFAELNRRGVLNHKVAAVDQVEIAMQQPPAVGRAKLRGDAIRRLSGQGRANCNWMAVLDLDGRTLNLSDPFATTEVWTDPPTPGPDGTTIFNIEQNDPFNDPGRFHQMLEALRGRRGRTRAGD